MLDTGVTAWMLTSASLVLLMTPGLAFFYGGMVRGKSVLNMMMLSFGAMAVVGVIYVLWGWSMSYGESVGGFFGNPFDQFGLGGSFDEIAYLDDAETVFMPTIVEFYTGQRPILPNVETWRCADPDSLKYVLGKLPELVVKEVHGSGGYGMLIGPTATRKEVAEFRKKLEAHPENYIAQPTLSLSTCPIFTRAGLAPRHVDLRPFVLVSPDNIDIVPGGLTRVAMKKGSLVVNSSQGGGTKDTWVLDD